MMYDEKDLQNLKDEYFDVKYPDDLNHHVISCVYKPQRRNNKSGRIMIYINVVLAACLMIGIFSVFRNSTNEIWIGKGRAYDVSFSRDSRSLDFENHGYMVSESEFLSSVYPNHEDINFNDNIFNIKKQSGEIVNLRDILSDDIENSAELSQSIKEILLGDESKFYIDQDGFYVVVAQGGSYKIDKNLESKIFVEILK